jgi:MFS family permease
MEFNNIHKSYVARFLRDLQFFGPISIPYFLDWIQVDYTKIFILQAWFVLWVVLFEIPTGIVADKLGRKASLALGCLLFGIDLLFFGLVRNYYLLYIAEFIGALGFTLISGADKALIYDSLIELKKKNEGKYYLSRHEAAGTLGIIVSFPLGSLIAGSDIITYPNSLPVIFILSGAFSILALFLYVVMKEPKRQKPMENFVKLGIDGLKHLHKHKVLRAFAINSVLISSITFFMFWFYQPLAGSAGLSITYYGFIGAGFNLFAALLLLDVTKLEKFFGMKNILFYSALVPALLFIGVALVKNVLFVVISIFLIIGLKLLRAPILSDFMNRHIESGNRATVLSSVSLMERIAIFIMYPIVGFLADITLSYALIFLGSLALVFTFITRIEEAHIL